MWESKAIIINPIDAYNKLLECKEPLRYQLKINKKYANCMNKSFWDIIIKMFHIVKFVNLEDNILYICKDRMEGGDDI